MSRGRKRGASWPTAAGGARPVGHAELAGRRWVVRVVLPTGRCRPWRGLQGRGQAGGSTRRFVIVSSAESGKAPDEALAAAVGGGQVEVWAGVDFESVVLINAGPAGSGHHWGQATSCRDEDDVCWVLA